MNPSSRMRRLFTVENAPAQHRRKRSRHPLSKQRYGLQLERLEDRMTPSVLLGTFELDGNATTGVLGPPSGSTTSSHDWDQVFADAGSPSGSGSFVQGSTSAALAGSFFTDKVS